MFERLLLHFRQNERGNVLLIVGGGIFLLVLAVGGAIDTARYLVARTQAQAALDNAVIAAAAVKDTQDVAEVGSRFFYANFPSHIGNISGLNISQSSDGNFVTGHVNVSINNYFSAFLGFDTYDYSGFSEVLVGQTATEIVLTLDTSPSMCQEPATGDPSLYTESCAKMNALKDAAKGFVDSIFALTPQGVKVGIVPFNHNVKMHPSLGKHPVLGPSVEIDGGPTPYLSQILEPTDNHDQIISHLNGLTSQQPSWGFTRTNIGTLVGALMLMPYSQDRQYFAHTSPDFPAPFDPVRLNKVLVLMTDGQNVVHFQPPAWPDFVPAISTDDNNHQAQLCQLLDDYYGMIIYTVTYDLADGPIKDIYRNCATNDQFYFDVSASGGAANLEEAYRMIAQSIARLRLYR